MKDLAGFRERLVSDTAFFEKYRGMKDVQKLLAMAKADGYEFTEDELRNDTDISDAKLLDISGGLLATGIIGGGIEYGGIIGNGIIGE